MTQHAPVTALGHSDMLREPEPARKPKTLRRALQLLAYRRDAEGVARYLRKRGLLTCNEKGLRTSNCPVAQYLLAETGAVAVTTGYATSAVAARLDQWDNPQDWSEAEHPQAVAEFISNFDDHEYDALRTDSPVEVV